MSSQGKRESTYPSFYEGAIKKFESEAQPKDQEGWIERARQVADILTEDAPTRDIQNKSPRGEIALIKSAGLLKVMGPKEYGGGGESWETAYKCIREVAAGDGSMGMLLGYHLLWSVTANVVGTEEQSQAAQKAIIENNYFVGGAVNPRDNDLKITAEDDDTIVFNGFKNFNTGGVISDLTVLEGVFEDTDKHIFTFVKTDQPGIQFSHNWDAVGMRLTESGSVRINNVKVPWTDALGWDPKKQDTVKEVLEIPFASMLLPSIQLVFTNFYLGIAKGAFRNAIKYTRTSTRPWPYGGDNKDKATDEFYILEKYGTYKAQIDALEALVDQAGVAIAKIYEDVGQSPPGGSSGSSTSNGQVNGGSSHASRAKITARRRGEVAAQVAHCKVLATDVGLEVTSGIFEMLGSRATGRKYGFDRFWRDIRTHSLHDPVAYKRREVGRFALLDEVPEPTWYT